MSPCKVNTYITHFHNCYMFILIITRPGREYSKIIADNLQAFSDCSITCMRLCVIQCLRCDLTGGGAGDLWTQPWGGSGSISGPAAEVRVPRCQVLCFLSTWRPHEVRHF